MFNRLISYIFGYIFVIIDKLYLWRLKYKVLTKKKWKEVRLIKKDNKKVLEVTEDDTKIE